MKLFNAGVRRVKENESWRIIHHDLDPIELKIVVITDSSFANNADLTIQLGFIIRLTNNTGRDNPLHYAN